MKSFFQRHSGAPKPTNDPTLTYQVWLPPAVEPNNDRTRHRTIQEPLDSTVNAHRTGEKRGSSRTPQITEVYSGPHVASSVHNYTTYASTGRGYHMPTHAQAASTAFTSVATPSYPDPGQYLDGSTGWSTSQRPSAPMRLPPVQHTSTVHREDARRQRRSDDRYRDTDKGREREQRTRERDVNVARYKPRVAERSSQKKDYVQYRERDEDRRRVSEDRERTGRRRSRERRNRDKEKGSESDRDRDWERERKERWERSRVYEKEKEYREAHRERERDRDRNLDGEWPTERNAGRDMARNLRKEREQDEHRERGKENFVRKGKARERDDDLKNLPGEYRLNGKGLDANAGRYGTGGITEVHKDSRERHPYGTSRREREDETRQRKQHDRVRDDRKGKDSLDRRFEPRNVEWDSASMLNSQPRTHHRRIPAHDEINSDSSPRKDLPKLSKHKRNLTDVEAHHLLITEMRDSVPPVPSDPALVHPRQATFASDSRENQAGYPNINHPSLSFGHHGKILTPAAAEQLSRTDPTAFAISLGEVGRSKYKEHIIGSDINNVTAEFPPASSTKAMLTCNDVQLPNLNSARPKYDEISNSLSSRWPSPKKHSTPGPSPLVDNTSLIERVGNQRLEKQPDHTIMIPKTMYSSASQQAALREAETGTFKYPTYTMKHSKLDSMDAPRVDSPGYLTEAHQGPHLSNQNIHPIPSIISAMTHVQPSAVQKPHIESHWHRPEITTLHAPQTAGLETSNVLNLMQPFSQAREQTSQVLFPHVSRAPSDPPTVDTSRKRTESTGSKDRGLTLAPSIHDIPKAPYRAVPLDNHSSIPSRTIMPNKVHQVEPKPHEVVGGISSHSQDIFSSVSNHMRSTHSTPVGVGMKGLIGDSVATSAQEQTSAREDASPQIHTRVSSSIERSVSQGASHPSIISNNTTEHKVTQQLPIPPMALPNTQSADITSNSKFSSIPDIRTQPPPSRTQPRTKELLLSQRGQTGPFPSMGIISTQSLTPRTRQTSSTEYLPQNASQAHAHRARVDNALYLKTQTSHCSLQKPSADSDNEAHALPTSVQSSSAVVLNESADYPQTMSTDILDQLNQALPTTLADQASLQTSSCTARIHDQRIRHPEKTESSRVHSTHQQRMAETRVEVVHSEDTSNVPCTLIDVKAMTNKISQSSFIPSSSNENLYQVDSPSNHHVHHAHGLAGRLEASSNVKTRAFSSDLSIPMIAAKDVNLPQSERPRELDIDIAPSSVLDTNYIDSRTTKAGDIGEVIISSVGGPTINYSVTSVSKNGSSSDPVNGPSRYRSSSESLAEPFGDGRGQVSQRDSPVLKASVPKLIAEYKASSIPDQAQPEAAFQILRPSTAIGYRQTSGQGSIPLPTGVVRDVSNDDKPRASAIQRPATAMSSRHYRSERSGVHDVLQAPGVQLSRPLAPLQSRPTDVHDALAHNPASLSTQSTNKSDVSVPVNTEGLSSKHMRVELKSTLGHRPEGRLHKMQLQGQQSYSSTLGSELELPITKKEVLTRTHGTPVVQGSQGDVPVIQHHVADDNTLASSRGDKNMTSSVQTQPKESVNRAIVPQGDQPPIQNARLAELLSNPAPLYQHIPIPETVNDLRNPRAVISRPGQLTVVRPGTDQPTTQLIQSKPASVNQKTRGSPEKHPYEVDSCAPTVQKSTRAPEQSQPLQNHITPSSGTLASTSQQSTPGSSHTFPPIAESTTQSRINQDHFVGPKSQKLVTSRSANHDFLSSSVHRSQPEIQTHLHTNPRNYDQNKVSHKSTVEPDPRTQLLPADNMLPPSMSAGTTQTSSHHQTSQKVSRSQDHSKTLHKHAPVIQLSHAASVHTTIPSNSLAYSEPPDTVPATHLSSYQQSLGVPSARDHDHYKASHKLAVASSNYLDPSSTSRSYVPSTQRIEPSRHRSQSIAPVNNPSSSQVDLMPSRHVSPSPSQFPQSSLQTNISVPAQSVSSSIKPGITSRSNAKPASRSTATAYPSESRPHQPGASGPDSKKRTSTPTNTFQSHPDTTLQQSMLTSSHLPDPASSRHNRKVSRKPSEDSVLKTPSSLAATILKPSTSRTSIPASFSSQTSSRKRGLFSMFRSKTTQPPDQAEEPQKSAPRKLRKDSKQKAENLSEATSPQDTKVTSAVSSRAKAPSITVPNPILQVAERKSPNKVFTPFRYLTIKRNRRVSQASLEAQDGTAPNTIIGSPTASIHSTQPLPIQLPPLRDVFVATQEWRHMEAAEVREVTGGRLRRARPGVVFDVAEDHREEDRPRIRPQSRQS